ncbi:hypothetical protein H6785_00910 [Candidatus Nomurabacteria bacterium]|nr:hypothetical protein [Candidatus Nomurabacteria bacterium]
MLICTCAILAGCSITSPSTPARQVKLTEADFEEFNAKKAADQATAKEEHIKKVLAVNTWNYMVYLTGEAVCWTNQTCAKWNPAIQSVAVWWEHDGGLMGFNSNAVVIRPTDKVGMVIGERAYVGQSQDQAGDARFLIDQFTRLIAPIGNGYLSRCKNCGGGQGTSVFSHIVTNVATESTIEANSVPH